MRVGLVTTWGIRCGHAEFASNIVDNLPQVEFKPITDMTDSGMLAGCQDVDLIHIVWSVGGFSPMTSSGVRQIQAMGKKVLISNQTTRPSGNRIDILNVADKVVSTEENEDGFLYIPMGVPDGWVATEKPEKMIGTVGFPFSWKYKPDLARAARQAGFGFLGILPDYPPTVPETTQQRAEIMSVHPEAILFKDWIGKEEVKKQLGRCAVQVFAHRPYPHGQTWGVSSACRYGIATGRPCIFNRFDMYRDLFPYEDGLYFAEPQNDTVSGLADLIVKAGGRE